MVGSLSGEFSVLFAFPYAPQKLRAAEILRNAL
jgi:hypothetical protein